MKTFEETKQMASDTLNDMHHELSLLSRTYRNYEKHGAVNAAAELRAQMEALENDIAAETQMFRMAFY